MKKIIVIVLLVGCIYPLQGQDKFWIVFKDKSIDTQAHYVSPQTLHNRKYLQLPPKQVTDAPVNTLYVDSLQQMGIKVISTSKWLNAISAFLTPEQLQKARKITFVQEVRPVNRELQISGIDGIELKPEYYSTVMGQLGASAFTEHGLTGKGVTIGVIDVGFFGVTSNKNLGHILQDNRITDIRDYVNPGRTTHFSELETNADFHGTEVLQMITGFEPDKKLQYGMATDATFCLARTDHGVKETRLEEDNWIMAMERMDSLGVRLINTSLGYALGFTNPKENYKPQDMDGKTSMISRASQIASEEKGILIVVSAGNEGDDPNWRIVSTPADAEGVISVGATKAKSRDRIGYSSIGPEFLPYLKPNVACFSPSGTSFSAPVITGFAACLMQHDSSLTNKHLKQIIEKSSHLYPYGNNYVGYGVPNAQKALQLLSDSTANVNKTREIKQKGDVCSIEIQNPSLERAVVFHKKNQFFVLEQKLVGITKGKLVIKRQPDEQRTTVDFGNEVVEVFWE